MIKLTDIQEQTLKEYMASILDKIENKDSDKAIGILLNEIAAWKVFEIVNCEGFEKSND